MAIYYTDDLTYGKNCWANSTYSTWYASKAIDNNVIIGSGGVVNSGWLSATINNGHTGSDCGAYIVIDLADAKEIMKCTLRQRQNGGQPACNEFKIDYSDDGGYWQTIYFDQLPQDYSIYTYTWDSVGFHRYWRIRPLNSCRTNAYVGIGQIELMARINDPPTISNLSAKYDIDTTNINVSANLSDIENDSIKYKILVNGVQAYPTTGYTGYVSSGTSISVDVPHSYFNQKVNTVVLVANDGKTDNSTSISYTKLVKYLFSDKNGLLYKYDSSNINFVNVGTLSDFNIIKSTTGQLIFSNASDTDKKDYKKLCLDKGHDNIDFLNVQPDINFLNFLKQKNIKYVESTTAGTYILKFVWNYSTMGKLTFIVCRQN